MLEKLVFFLIELVAKRHEEYTSLGHGDYDIRRCYIFPSGTVLYLEMCILSFNTGSKDVL